MCLGLIITIFYRGDSGSTVKIFFVTLSIRSGPHDWEHIVAELTSCTAWAGEPALIGRSGDLTQWIFVAKN